MLQWSRTLTSAEISLHISPLNATQKASMEPHSYECGNSDATYSNGTITRLQWSRTLTSAEMNWSRAAAAFFPPGFNGAALLRVRKCCPSEYLISQGFGKG